MTLGTTLPFAERLLEDVKKIALVEQADLAGSIRRRRDNHRRYDRASDRAAYRQPRPIDFDFQRVIRRAAEAGVALEINGSPLRTDLPDTMARLAQEAGVWLVINSDAHSVHQLEYGVFQARRGWVRPENVISTWDASKLLTWLRSRRSGEKNQPNRRRRLGTSPMFRQSDNALSGKAFSPSPRRAAGAWNTSTRSRRTFTRCVGRCAPHLA